MSERLPKYLENPEKYCERINALLQQGSDEWQTVWKAAMPELSNLQANEISMINSLLKPVESAFKSKDSKLRVQAFDCWAYFVIHCEKIKVSDKLWNVLLIPLLAHNHSVYIVLSAKLKTWHTFVDTSFMTKPNIMKKAVPSILKCLYGPHTLDTACNFAALSETCGNLYHKIMVKCAPHDEAIENIFSYLEKAIPPLSNMENTQKIAKLIWSDALRIICDKEWAKNHFTYLMRTLENLISDSKNDGFQLISNFLSILVNIYGSFPPDRLTPHLNLVIRCLFHPPVNVKVMSTIMNSMLRICEKPSFFFHQLGVVLMSTADSNKNDIDTLWITVASCYKKWVKNNRVNESDPPNHDYSTACRILLFPLDQMCELSDDLERFNFIMKTWKSCYEECATSAAPHCDKFLLSLTEKIEASIEKASKQETRLISNLKVAVSFCNTILTLIKFSDAFSHVKPVLLKISKSMPDLKTLTDSDLKSLAVKYVVTVLSYVKLFPAHSEDFSYIIKTFGPLLPKDVEEIAQKLTDKSDEDGDSSGKLSNGVAHLSTIATPLAKTKLRTSLLERLSPAGRKADVEVQSRSQTTPKASKSDDDDVQFVAITPKPKNSPMTEHQREMAKATRYIPALYQDLSQSHSQSQSQSESVSILSGNKKSNDAIMPELFEDNANLPSATSTENNSNITPESLSFRTGLAASAEKTAISSKKSLFTENKSTSEESESNSAEVILQKDNENLPPIIELDEDTNKEKSTIKRKNAKAIDTPAEVTPVKRSKRLSNRLEGHRPGPKSRTQTPREEGRKRKSSATIDDPQPAGKEEVEVEEIICLIDDSESQNVFVANKPKTSGVSSPLNSLMNVKDDETAVKAKRKSLRSRKSTTPLRSPISTRKRRSSALAVDGALNSKKSLFADSTNAVQCSGDAKKVTYGSNVQVIVPDIQLSGKKFTVGDETRKSVINEVAEEVKSKDATEVPVKATEEPMETEPAGDTTKSSPNKSLDSVILMETNCEVISIEDSDRQTEKKSIPGPIQVPKIEDVSDESTFFEGSEEAKNPSNEKATEQNEPVNKGVSVIRSTNQAIISPEILASGDGNVSDTYTVCNAESNEDGAVSSVSILENPSTGASNGSQSILESSANQKTSEMVEIESSGEKVTDGESNKDVESSDTNSETPASSVEKESKSNASISPIHSNSRASQMMKLAVAIGTNGSHSAEATKTYGKPSRRTLLGTDQVPNVRPPNRRLSRMFSNIKFDKESTITPPKIITTTCAEKLMYPPKECTSPGILKKPDANQNTSSPRSLKFVNFADKLTSTKEFLPDDQIDTDSLISTGDNPSNNNLINNEELKSQEVLYSPLRNCRDDIKHVIEFIFTSSCSKIALDQFQRLGINTVGQLAGMSTMTANSIPAGDNRVQRLRQALKKYDESISKKYESKGLRRPSARRRILKTTIEFDNYLEVSSIIDLLEPGEFVEESASPEPNDAEENDTVSANVVVEPNTSGQLLEESEKLVEAESANVHVEEIVEPDARSAEAQVSEAVAESNEVENTDIHEPVELMGQTAYETAIEPVEHMEQTADETTIEPIKAMEIEPVKKLGENKENVDPLLDDCSVSVVTETPPIRADEPMDVDKASTAPKANDSANESLDYVCTDNEHIYKDSSDRISITIMNIHKSTLIEVQNDELKASEERTDADAPETMTEDGCEESPSIFAKQIVTVEDTIEELPSVVECSNAMQLQEASQSIIESDLICAQEPSQQQEKPQNVIESEPVEHIDRDQSAEIIHSGDPTHPGPVRQPDNIESVTEFSKEGWRDMLRQVSPLYQGPEEVAKAYVISVLKAFQKSLSKMDIELTLSKKN